MSAAKLPSAGPGQQEREACVLDEPVNLVEEHRELLDLVDHDQPGAPSAVAFAEEGRPRRIFREDVRLEKVDQRRIRKRLADPEALAHPTRTPQKGRPSRGQAQIEKALEYPSHVGPFIRIICP